MKIDIQSNDIFTINSIGFNEDYSAVVQLGVTKSVAYSDNVTFIVAVYDKATGEMVSVSSRKMSAKNIARYNDGDAPVGVPMNAPMPEGITEAGSDKYDIWVYTMTSDSENEAVTEADGTIEAAFGDGKISFTKTPEFDASSPVIVMVVKPGTVTTSVKDEDIVYIKQVNGADLAALGDITVSAAETGDYIIKMAGKINGVSEIATGIAAK